uniref:DUF2256 domain-containing protein n=1 Tax=Arundo donax TaxID=35708 RepID=A0A0A9ALG8_ARUDO
MSWRCMKCKSSRWWKYVQQCKSCSLRCRVSSTS